jgi:hypothetical protein
VAHTSRRLLSGCMRLLVGAPLRGVTGKRRHAKGRHVCATGAPHSIAVSKLSRPLLSCFLIAVRLFRQREKLTSLTSPCRREPSTECPWASGPPIEMKIKTSPPRNRGSMSGRKWIPDFAGMT